MHQGELGRGFLPSSVSVGRESKVNLHGIVVVEFVDQAQEIVHEHRARVALSSRARFRNGEQATAELATTPEDVLGPRVPQYGSKYARVVDVLQESSVDRYLQDTPVPLPVVRCVLRSSAGPALGAGFHHELAGGLQIGFAPGVGLYPTLGHEPTKMRENREVRFNFVEQTQSLTFVSPGEWRAASRRAKTWRDLESACRVDGVVEAIF